MADLIKGILGCSLSDAQHYLAAFGDDAERAVLAVSENGDDKGWWAHPWNSESASSGDVKFAPVVSEESKVSVSSNDELEHILVSFHS